MNPMRLLYLFLLETGEGMYGWSRERLTHTVRTLYIAVLLPAILLVAGIASGMIGEATKTMSFITTAEFLIALSGFLAALLFAFFWMKVAVLTHLFAAASRVASGITGALPKLEELPHVDHESAEAFLKWMRGVTGWLTLVCLYGMIVPIWRHLTWTLVAGTVFLFLSAAMTAKWVDGDRMKKIVIALTVVVLGYATANLVAPVRMAQFRYGMDRSFDRVSTWSGNHVAMGELERQTSVMTAEQSRDLVAKFRKRQYDLRKSAYGQCGGKFCSVQDELEYRDLDRKIEEIKDGTYWSGKPEKEEKKTSKKPVRPVPAKMVSGARKKAPRKTLSQAETDNVFSELDKYNDL